jgi:hypothetical protein
MSEYCLAVAILGIPNATVTPYTTDAMLCTSKPIDAATLPMVIGSGGAVQVVPCIDTTSAVEGISITSDIREPVRGASAVEVVLVDIDDALSKLFAVDVGNRNTQYIDVTDTKITSSATTIGTALSSAPSTGEIWWLENEAVQITAATTQQITVQRAACGSRARTHRIRAESYVPGDNGISESMMLTSRPDLDSYAFDVELYLLRVSNGEATSVVWKRSGYLARRPTPTGDGRWRLTIEDNSKKVEDHKWQREPFSLQYEVRILSFAQARAPGILVDVHPSLAIGTSNLQAKDIMLLLTRYEIEMLINEPFHRYGIDKVDKEMIDGVLAADGSFFAASAVQAGKVQLHIELEIGSHKYVYRLVPPSFGNTANGGIGTAYTFLGAQTYAVLYATLVGYEQGTSIDDATFDTSDEEDVQPSLFNASWYYGLSFKIAAAGTEPKIRLRVHLDTNPIEAMLYLLHSDAGGGVTDPDYDVIPGAIGIGFYTDQINHGAALPDALDVADDTDQMLQLAQLLPIAYSYPISLDQEMKDWMENICRLHTLLFGTKPSNGALMLRLWSKASSTPIQINPLSVPIEVGDRLEPLRAILVDVGYDSVTLEPKQSGISIRTKGALPKHLKDAQQLRIWTDQIGPSLAQITQLTLSRAIISFFAQLQGEPESYNVPTFLGDVVYSLGDVVAWTDNSIAIPTPTGHGTPSGTAYLVHGITYDLSTGVQTLSLLPDLVTPGTSSKSKVAPILDVTVVNAIIPVAGGYQVELEVDGLGETITDLSVDDLGIWSALAAVSGRCRLVNPTLHNPLGLTPLGSIRERKPGWLEASALVTAVSGNVITLFIEQSWERDGITINDIVSVNTWILLTDRRAPLANVEGVGIAPIPEQLFNNASGLDFAKIAPASGLPFDSHISLWSA